MQNGLVYGVAALVAEVLLRIAPSLKGEGKTPLIPSCLAVEDCPTVQCPVVKPCPTVIQCDECDLTLLYFFATTTGILLLPLLWQLIQVYKRRRFINQARECARVIRRRRVQ